MQTAVSFLPKRNKESSNKLVHQRLQSVAQQQVDNDGLGQAATEGTHAQSLERSSEARSLMFKSKGVFRFLYKWFTRALLVVLLILLAVLIMFMWSPTLDSTPTKIPAPVSRMTARTAHTTARPVALGWAADSQLVGLSATWNADQIFAGDEGDWSLTFYSPSKSKTALVSVVDGRATLISARGVARVLQPQSLDLWQIDSPEVVDQLRANGGNEFLRNQPDASLSVTLNLLEDAAWKARLIHQESRREFFISVDIESGAVIELAQSG